MFKLFSRILVSVIVVTVAACALPTSKRQDSDLQVVQNTDVEKVVCLTTTAGVNQAAVQATNVTRQKFGLRPLRQNATLAKAAAAHACDMAVMGRMTHVGQTSRGPGRRAKQAGYRPFITAENIAAGPFDLDRVLAEWGQSKGHLENILIPQLSDFGIGEAIGSDGRTRFWAAVYATPKW